MRDAIAVTQEAVLTAVMDEIMATAEDCLVGRALEKIVGTLMERVEERDSASRDLCNIARALNAKNPLYDKGLLASRVQR